MNEEMNTLRNEYMKFTFGPLSPVEKDIEILPTHQWGV